MFGNSISIFLFSFVLLSSSFAFADSACRTIIPDAVKDFTETFNDRWEARVNRDQCKIESLDPVCKNLFSADEFKSADWKKYASACSAEGDKVDTLLELTAGCFGGFKDIGVMIGEALAESTLTTEKYIECNNNPTIKMKLILEHNKNLPFALKYKIDENFDIKKTTCQEIESLLKRNFNANKTQWLAKRYLNLNAGSNNDEARFGYYAEKHELTDDELQVQTWFQNEAAKQMLKQIDSNVLDEIKHKVDLFGCYNRFYKTKFICNAIFAAVNFTGAAQTGFSKLKRMQMTTEERLALEATEKRKLKLQARAEAKRKAKEERSRVGATVLDKIMKLSDEFGLGTPGPGQRVRLFSDSGTAQWQATIAGPIQFGKDTVQIPIRSGSGVEIVELDKFLLMNLVPLKPK